MSDAEVREAYLKCLYPLKFRRKAWPHMRFIYHCDQFNVTVYNIIPTTFNFTLYLILFSNLPLNYYHFHKYLKFIIKRQSKPSQYIYKYISVSYNSL